ncbi:hypothetical protein TWF225_001378 [Orbilia oligospora]|uniref:DUF7907 domain-containing protein n=3 Tax=Orbilia oligospora TaxID=2813651 RepID=G1XFA0_ARTOA|nr:hypothetical protein AOL_s00081g41 [Orbilia oligospora ATCC 24927]KAF3089347.1 hypothetical protein TWF706_010461 [Orbilia oligospora]EGX48178.1 hypothetical protein AOL_s00081g41 [Orbilia oligospora ATCC 24927]KAF3133309.1 hypothetical protein TWF594_009258 [Orbilia oligospora]KAF3165933.1 hypothetical protein TWF751_008916 [Orbilia oligospora]KAF3191225.1 hypothetical protein TWF225_001378 [Orbilia oligospora]
MKFFSTVLAALLCLTTSVSAIKNTTRQFHLRTKLLGPTYERAKFNNLFVYSYHTGAGLSDACFDVAPIPNGNGIAFLNKTGSNIIFNLSKDFPWGLSRTFDTRYNQWESVTIDAGEGESGYKFNGSGLVRPGDSSFGGWLVCDWAHATPQLFWRYAYYSKNLPRSCANVELHPVYL